MNTPHVKIPPLILTVIPAVAMWALTKIFPDINSNYPFRGSVALILVIAGSILSLSGIFSFLSAKTGIDPLKPESVKALVGSGIYSITRNPMYLGLLFILTGWAYYLSNILTFVFIPAYAVYINYFHIIHEEATLETKFGEKFIQYKSKVRRWI